jgi:putative FmdB family regulatory protein
MPIYEYRCASCGNEHEALQKITEPLLTTCPVCHQNTLTKLVSAAGFKLKGSGWYATDFKNGSKPAAKTESNKESSAEAKTDSQAKSESKGESKTQSKSESKTESKSESSKSDGSGRSETKSETKPAETKSGSSTPAPSDASR